MDVQSQLEKHRQSKTVAAIAGGTTLNPVEKGVTISWLAAAFGITETGVRYRLRSCPVKAVKNRGTKMHSTLYDLPTAAKFLVSPAVSTREYMKALKRGDLPPQLQDTVWSAMLKRQQWEENAGELWRTEKIREVLASTFQSIKFEMQLWDSTIERNMELSEEQRNAILVMKDALAEDIYAALVKNMEAASTGSQLTEVQEQFGDSETATELMADEDDYGDVI